MPVSMACLAQEQEVPGSVPCQVAYFVPPSADSRRAVVNYWRKFVHLVLVKCLGSLSLPTNSVVRLTDHPNMTIAVYRGQ